MVLGSMLAASTMGCSDDEAASIDVGPTGPPSISFVSPASGGAAVCVAIGTDVQGHVPLQTKTEELVLRPPDACGANAQCGHLRLYANGIENNEAASEVIDLLLGKLADPYHDGADHPGTGKPDVLEVRVDVVEDDGEPMLDHDDEPLTDTVDLITVVSCSG